MCRDTKPVATQNLLRQTPWTIHTLLRHKAWKEYREQNPRLCAIAGMRLQLAHLLLVGGGLLSLFEVKATRASDCPTRRDSLGKVLIHRGSYWQSVVWKNNVVQALCSNPRSELSCEFDREYLGIQRFERWSRRPLVYAIFTMCG
jgi:hypothetical protein